MQTVRAPDEAARHPMVEEESRRHARAESLRHEPQAARPAGLAGEAGRRRMGSQIGPQATLYHLTTVDSRSKSLSAMLSSPANSDHLLNRKRQFLMNIPKRLGHIWIGPRERPEKWMATWREKHPHWNYTLYDNDYLKRTDFYNQHLIDAYWQAGEYAGVADLMRYEILFERGGQIAAADSECLLCTDELWESGEVFTVYENEFVRGKLVSPIIACQPGNQFVRQLIDELHRLKPEDLDTPWVSTGNLFVARMIAIHNPEIVVFPSQYFIPWHYEGLCYTGPDKVFAKQYFGTTRKIYGKFPLWSAMRRTLRRLSTRHRRRRQRKVRYIELPPRNSN